MICDPLPDLLIEPLVRNALQEDLGRAGDITTNAVIPSDVVWRGAIVARQAGRVAGLDLARMAFQLVDPTITFDIRAIDGAEVRPKDTLVAMTGSARGIITAERVALNFLCHMSGIATETSKLVEAVKSYGVRICCTRKTTPGLRALEKYAVRAGGGHNHRFGLDDAVLIKDNHIAVAGSITTAVMRARQALGHLVKLELEVDTLTQLQEALTMPDRSIDVILLDNMDTGTLKQAVEMVGGRCVTEASGGVTFETIKAIASTGVDIISVGWITHSAPILDIGLDAT